MEHYFIFKKYKDEKKLGLNFCIKKRYNNDWIHIITWKEIYIKICLIWIEVETGIKTKAKEMEEICK